jgi:hypothetical protein
MMARSMWKRATMLPYGSLTRGATMARRPTFCVRRDDAAHHQALSLSKQFYKTSDAVDTSRECDVTVARTGPRSASW